MSLAPSAKVELRGETLVKSLVRASGEKTFPEVFACPGISSSIKTAVKDQPRSTLSRMRRVSGASEHSPTPADAAMALSLRPCLRGIHLPAVPHERSGSTVRGGVGM